MIYKKKYLKYKKKYLQLKSKIRGASFYETNNLKKEDGNKTLISDFEQEFQDNNESLNLQRSEQKKYDELVKTIESIDDMDEFTDLSYKLDENEIPYFSNKKFSQNLSNMMEKKYWEIRKSKKHADKGHAKLVKTIESIDNIGKIKQMIKDFKELQALSESDKKNEFEDILHIMESKYNELNSELEQKKYEELVKTIELIDDMDQLKDLMYKLEGNEIPYFSNKKFSQNLSNMMEKKYWEIRKSKKHADKGHAKLVKTIESIDNIGKIKQMIKDFKELQALSESDKKNEFEDILHIMESKYNELKKIN